MIGPFASVEKKTRATAEHWLELAEKIENYRRDVMAPSELAQLQRRQQSLRAAIRERRDASQLQVEVESLEDALRRTGGAFYPKSTLTEYIEFFLVAAIVILGLRAFFVQPFKIPTNSMWPSYHGMTGEVFPTPADEPGFVARGFRFVTELALARRVDAPVEGEIAIPVTIVDNERHVVPYRAVPGKKWFLLPTIVREYEIGVGRTPVTVRVPADFDLDRVLLDAFFEGADRFPVVSSRSPGQTVLLRTGRNVAAGDRVLAFDILTGDQLFVDRLSYHFVKPRVGQGFVFRTGHLPDLHRLVSGPNDQYYIKRLVGGPGDVLEIREPVLYRNGEPITGSESFGKNAERVDNYPGFRPEGRMQEGVKVEIPADRYMAMGDNSASSLDSRYWGSIPAKDVVGRPLLIYYPFTKRWGPAP